MQQSTRSHLLSSTWGVSVLSRFEVVSPSITCSDSGLTSDCRMISLNAQLIHFWHAEVAHPINEQVVLSISNSSRHGWRSICCHLANVMTPKCPRVLHDIGSLSGNMHLMSISQNHALARSNRPDYGNVMLFSATVSAT